MTVLNKSIIKRDSCILLIIALGFLSCNKTKDYPKLNLLINKEWNLIKVEKSGENITSSCNYDDVLIFANDKDFQYNFGLENCDESETSKESVKFKMIDDYTVIRMKYKLNENSSRAGLIEYWEVIELNDSLLIVQDALAEDNDQTPEVYTFIHQ